MSEAPGGSELAAVYVLLGNKTNDRIGPGCSEILEGHISRDHVHLVLSIPPKVAVSEVVATIKGRVAIRMFRDMPEIRKKYWGRRLWSRGFFVSTVGVNEGIISKYIQNQELKERQAEHQGFEY